MRASDSVSRARATLTINGNTEELVGWGGGGRGGGRGISRAAWWLSASSTEVSDPAARSPVQKQEMPARGSSGGPSVILEVGICRYF
jgi:hypothetical protein